MKGPYDCVRGPSKMGGALLRVVPPPYENPVCAPETVRPKSTTSITLRPAPVSATAALSSSGIRRTSLGGGTTPAEYQTPVLPP